MRIPYTNTTTCSRMSLRIPRRNFLGLAGGACIGRMLVPRALRGQNGAGRSKLNVACIGVGHMGSAAVREAALENLVALCDVDWRTDPAVVGKNSAAEMAGLHPGVERFNDFRAMFERRGRQIDAVMVSTPDHIHFPAAMAAMELGKHVFVQKPLAHNIWQVRTMQRAAHRYGVITNMGSQGHCSEGIRRIKEWFDAGVLGEVREVHCWTDRPIPPWFVRPQQIPPVEEPIPEDLDWDLWQGPVARRSYSPDYLPTRWRGWWEYGVGALGDIGCHCLDAPFWALRLGMPTTVEVLMDEPASRDFTAFGAHVIYHFPARENLPPVQVHWYEGRPKPPLLPGMESLPSNGMYMLGSHETLFHGDMRPNSPTLWPRERMVAHGDDLHQERIPRVKGGPFKEFLNAVKGEGPKPGSNFDYAAPLTEVVLLGSLAIRLGHRIEWDAPSMRVTNSAMAQALIKEPVRPGWRYGDDLWR